MTPTEEEIRGRGFLLQRKVMTLTWEIAAVWIGLALAATLISIRIGVSVALVEILVGTLGGNLLALKPTPWIDFLAGFGRGIALVYIGNGKACRFTEGVAHLTRKMRHSPSRIRHPHDQLGRLPLVDVPS